MNTPQDTAGEVSQNTDKCDRSEERVAKTDEVERLAKEAIPEHLLSGEIEICVGHLFDMFKAGFAKCAEMKDDAELEMYIAQRAEAEGLIVLAQERDSFAKRETEMLVKYNALKSASARLESALQKYEIQPKDAGDFDVATDALMEYRDTIAKLEGEV